MMIKEEVKEMQNDINKKGNTILIVIVVIAILAFTGFYLYQNNTTGPLNTTEEGKMMADDKMQNSADEAMSDGGENAMTGDKYVEFTPENYSEYKDKKRILFFYANWCPTCIPANANFQKNADDLPNDVVMIRVNYDDSQTDDNEVALAQQYGVTYQHTFVQIDENGNEVTKWNGSVRMSSVLKNIR